MRLLMNDDRSRLIAHLAGGGDLFRTSRALTVGRLNIQAAERLLDQMNVPVISSDCGGTQARRVRFEVDTGELKSEKVGKGTEANR
jgi:chemotaxis protein CheD